MGEHDEKMAWLEDGISFVREMARNLRSGVTQITTGGVDKSKDLAEQFERKIPNFEKPLEAWKKK